MSTDRVIIDEAAEFEPPNLTAFRTLYLTLPMLDDLSLPIPTPHIERQPS